MKFLRKAMKRYGNPHIIVTDRLRSYRAAMREIGNAARQETGRWLNNRAENTSSSTALLPWQSGVNLLPDTGHTVALTDLAFLI